VADEYNRPWRTFGPDSDGRSMFLLYVHTCETLCYFCACNKAVTRQHGRAGPHLNYLTGKSSSHGRVKAWGNRSASCGRRYAHISGATPSCDLMHVAQKFQTGAGR
jgi:coproporphyrinogen III oxidase-like Fe-S oxidoreductase